MKKLLLILFLLPLAVIGQKSYWETTRTTFDGKNAFVSLPASYADSAPKRYPVILFIPGNGEVGSDTNLLKKYGPHKYIRDSLQIKGIPHPTTGDTIESIIISVQPTGAWVSEAQVKEWIDSLRIGTRWRIDTFRINFTGLSNGAWAAHNHITNDTFQAKQIASIVPMHGPITDNGASNAIKHGLMATYARKGGLIWGFEDSISDGRLMNISRDSCNRAVPGSYRYTGRPEVNAGHGGWNRWYSPNYTENVSGTTMNIYQWMLTRARPDAYTYWETPGDLTANAGSDTAYIYDQGGVSQTFTLNGSADNATSPTYSWAALAGNPASTTITSSSSASTTVTGANVPGYYGYELTVTDGASDKDTVYMQLRDLQVRGLRPCRVGAPVIHTFGDVLIPGRVTTTEMYAQHITRDNLLPAVQGGDIIMIPENPNNDTGYWRAIHFGDISGSPGCPIRVVPDSVSGMTVVSGPQGSTRGWYIATADNEPGGTADSNTVAHVIFDGGYWYHKTGIRHGFRGDNRAYVYDSSDVVRYSLNTGISAHLIHDVEITGFGFWNTGYMMQIKIYSDSTQPFTIWNNFRQANNWIHHNYSWKALYEGIYGGHTDWNGLSQGGNDGRTLMQDSLLIEKNVFVMTGQDPLQVANHGSGAIVRDNMSWMGGYRNVSSHRWGGFIGGNANGSLYRNTWVNQRGSVGTLGYGTVRIYENILDSINDGGNTEPAFYINKASWTGNTDSLKAFIYNNLVSRVAKTTNSSFVQVDNSANLMAKGAIRNNTFVHPTKTLISQMVTTNAADTVENNTILASLDISTHPLASMDSYRMYQLVRSVPDGTPVSFYDLQIVRQFGGRKQLHKGRKFNFKYK